MFSRMQDARQVENIDVLFIGSSVAYRSFDPAVFSEKGISTFNLGSDMQTPRQTYFLLNRYLEQMNPRLVVWAVTPLTLEVEGLESTLDIIANDFIDKSALKLVSQTPDILGFNTFFYALIREVTGRNKSFKPSSS